MTLQEQLLDLDVTVGQISRGINAVAAMSRGLDQLDDPYADGFYAISDYLPMPAGCSGTSWTPV